MASQFCLKLRESTSFLFEMHRSYACQLPALQKKCFSPWSVCVGACACACVPACMCVMHTHNLYTHTHIYIILSEPVNVSSTTQCKSGSPDEQLEKCFANLLTELNSAYIVLLSLRCKGSVALFGFLSYVSEGWDGPRSLEVQLSDREQGGLDEGVSHGELPEVIKWSRSYFVIYDPWGSLCM